MNIRAHVRVLLRRELAFAAYAANAVREDLDILYRLMFSSDLKKGAMKKKAKVKSEKRAAKKSEEPEIPSLFAIMEKIAERLQTLERKVDLILDQTAEPQPKHLHNQSPRQEPQRSLPSQHRPQPQAHHGPKPHLASQHSRGPQPGKERMLFQAVCAECKQECEVPFKPSGERPVYCKECFAKRKSKQAGDSQKSLPAQAHLQGASSSDLRRVMVKKHGVGKITVSEMISARSMPSKRKNSKMAKNSR